MSFILDALKKAEAERQRQTGPTLLEVRVTAPRRRFPLWTLILAALLGVNILLLLIFVLRRPAATNPTPAPVAAAGAAVSTAPVPVSAPASVPASAPASAPVPAPAPVAVAPPMAATPTMPTTTSAAPVGNPADYEPAVPAGDATAAHRVPESTPRGEPPSLAEIGGDLPDLRLDLHVYATRPADRYALINMHRVREGDVLPEGPRVIAIDRDGVELNYRGTEFMLRPQ